MKSHLRFVSKAPSCASSNFEIKLSGVSDIIDTLLLAQRQSAWKAFFPIGGDTGTSPTTTTGDTGGFGGGGQ